MAQARQHPFVSHAARPQRAWVSALLWALGLGLLAYFVYLFFAKVSHTGSFVVSAVAALAIAAALWRSRWQAWVQARAWRRRLWRASVWGAGLWLASFVLFAISISGRGGDVPAGFVPQWVVVLGSSTPNEQPSPALRERLDKALQLAAQFPQARIIVSGGVDFRETTSEARVMARYLQAQGLPAQRILEEDRSTSTHLNLLYSLQMAQTQGGQASDAFVVVTNDFHTPRASAIARKAGLSHVHAAGAPTPLYMRYVAWLREYFACLAGIALGELRWQDMFSAAP